MKKIILGILVIVGLSSCGFTEQEKLGKLISPVTVVGIGEVGSYCSNSASVTLKSADGFIQSFSCREDIAIAVSNSRQVGDTLK